jgi:hypothetical protein
LKPPAVAYLVATAGEGQTIVVVRPGGKIVVDDRTVTAAYTNFKNFCVGDQYVLFLDYAPKAQAYTADQVYTFHLSDKGMETLMLRPLYPAAEREGLDAFLVDARAAAATCGDSER